MAENHLPPHLRNKSNVNKLTPNSLQILNVPNRDNKDENFITLKNLFDGDEFQIMLDGNNENIDIVLKAICEYLKMAGIGEEHMQSLNMIKEKFSSLIIINCVETFLENKRMDKEKEKTIQCANSLTEIYLQIIHQSPSRWEKIESIVKIIKKKLKGKEKSIDSFVKLNEALEEARQNKYLIVDHNDDAKNLYKYEAQQEGDRNYDDFRKIDEFPTLNELDKNYDPYLNRNIVKGHFKNLDHYLDIQYRLLREDVMEPLRTGINAYKGDGKSELRVYKEVRAINTECTENGVEWIVQFKPIRKVKWEFSRRLIFGSLVCLSKTADKFNDMFFATVSNRDVKLLKDYRIAIRLEKNAEMDITKSYTMVESVAYFESARHVLKGLQGLRDNLLPFEDILLYGKTNIVPPKYIKDNPYWDLSDLAVPKDTATINELKSFNVARNDWPDASKLELDDSQLQAIKSVLNQELTLIQGPPGTGKTHVGLKLAKVLLTNRDKWPVLETGDEPGPMLVVCFSNHALDKFLEDIVQFEQNVLRVGGRSKSEILQKYTIREKKRSGNYRDNSEIRATINKCRGEMKNLSEKIMKLGMQIDNAWRMILNEEVLKSFMGCGKYYMEICQVHMTKNKIFYWLCLHCLGMWYDGNYSEMNFNKNDERSNESDIDNDYDGYYDNDEDIHDRLVYGKTTNLQYMEYKEELISFKSDCDKAFKDQLLQKRIDFDKLQEQIKKALRFGKGEDVLKNSPNFSIWNLNNFRRWQLYLDWRDRYIASMKLEINELSREYNEIAAELKVARENADAQICKQHKVIAMTTSCAARLRHVLPIINSPIVLVEEAAEVFEAHIITSLTMSCKHLILIGDHKQLRPSPTVYKLQREYDYDVSLFERLVNNGIGRITLDLQRRMRPEISNVIRLFYDDLKDDRCVLNRDNVNGMAENLFFMHTDFPEDNDEEEDGTSHSNGGEAEIVLEFVKYLRKQDITPNKITILTGYVSQVATLKRQTMEEVVHVTIDDNGREKKFSERKVMEIFKDVRITPIDNYQGEENDVIVLSLVRSNNDNKLGFLKNPNRICVALSRAKYGLYVFGNLTMFRENNDIWETIIKRVGVNCYGNVLKLKCNYHGNITNIQTASDFEKVSEGGCNQYCNNRLNCGHVCRLLCHSYDREHVKYLCKKECGKVLSCGVHTCKKYCHQECGDCMNEIEGEAKCGHIAKKKCSQDNVYCSKECGVTLDCGHKCVGNCTSCRIGRLHKACGKPCGRELPCGHICTEPCTNDCPPCKLPCLVECKHSKCSRKCGEECVNCRELCFNNCKHGIECLNLCYEKCQMERCQRPCYKILSCGHRCVGFCMDPCPNKCFKCHPDFFENSFFGTEDTNSVYVMLPCQHTFDSQGLDKYMLLKSEEPDIGFAKCPLPECKSPIINCQRYKNLIMKQHMGIQSAKRKIKQAENHLQDEKVNLEFQINRLLGKSQANRAPERVQYICMLMGEETKKETFNGRNLALYKTKLNVLNEIIKFPHNRMTLTLQKDMDFFAEWIFNVKSYVSDQQEKDLRLELYRLKVHFELCDLTEAFSKANLSPSKEILDTIENFETGSLIKEHQLKDYEKRFEETWQTYNLTKHKYASSLALTDTERLEIVKAINLPKGHWYQCPNGHAYAIGECGGAEEESKCAECGAKIGGTNHTLVEGNRHAGQIDGSEVAAWSEDANLAAGFGNLGIN